MSVSEFQALNPSPAGSINLDQTRHLLRFALLAPSVHNTVPVAFGLPLDRSEVDVFVRRQHVLSASDPTGREALVSLGCSVENLMIAAAQYGIECSWRPEPGLSWKAVGPSPTCSDVRVGSVQLTSQTVIPDESQRRSALNAMLERKVVRAEFDKAPLPAELKVLLRACVKPSERIGFELFESDRDKFAWGKLDELAMKHKLEERAFQLELGHWLLPNADASSVRGMRGREFGFDDRLTLELSAQLRGEVSMAADQLAFMARAGRGGLQSASAICVLSCLDELPDTAISAGRVYQRCALLTWAHGIAHAVHAGVCNVPHARAMSQATLLRGKMPPSVIFRLGKPLQGGDWSRPHSSRPDLSDVLHIPVEPESLPSSASINQALATARRIDQPG